MQGRPHGLLGGASKRGTGLCALLCLSCLDAPYDPIEAKPLCQEEISGGHCAALHGAMFQLHAVDTSPTLGSLLVKHSDKNTVLQSGIAHRPCTHRCTAF